MFVGPFSLAFGKRVAGFRSWWGWWRVGDFRNEVCGRGFRDAVDENSQKGDFQKDVEPHAEAKE